MSKYYCPLPFRHAYVDSLGIAACCQTPRYPVTLDQWPDHPKLQKLQQELLSGIRPEQCSNCARSEELYGTSLRLDAMRDYGHFEFIKTRIDFIDFRSVNICNFKCRSCAPVFSHGIANEVNNNVVLQRFFPPVPAGKTASVTDTNAEWIRQNLKSLKRIMFTGGEPTLIPGVRELIQEIQNHYPDIMVLITSNASFEDDFWFEITESLPNLHWTVSIDAVGSAAELVRHGTKWAVVERNVRWLAQYARSMDINSVISNLNIFSLRPLLEFGRELQRLGVAPLGRQGDLGCRHQFYVCQRPYHLAADNLTPELLSQAVVYLQDCEQLDLDTEQRNMLTGLIHQIKSAQFDPKLWQTNVDYNQALDSIRNENHMTLYNKHT
jgi:organic radical activating enzyme